LRGAEDFPDCLTALIEETARAGMLRLGLLFLEGEPAAAQIWIVSAGRATIWRARVTRQSATLSVGVVLTYEMIRHALAAEHLRVLGFGPGDERGQHEWFGRRRGRIGVVAFNSWTAKGWLSAARHVAGQRVTPMRRVLGTAWRRLVPQGGDG
jgi:CelD/BcsL family acetyltransferase involved in cellulose biosynthesis